MSIFQANCPYCGTNGVAFSVIEERPSGVNFTRRWETFAICGHCARAVLAIFYMPDDNKPSDYMKAGASRNLPRPELFPSPTATEASEHTPDNVARFYTQGMENLSRNWDAAGTMFRKALDTGLKKKFPELRGNLKTRIDRAVADGKLLPELGDWAHQIRLGGNDAAHDDEPFTKEEAEGLQTFTRLVFLYLFTLPGMLEEARRSEVDTKGPRK